MPCSLRARSIMALLYPVYAIYLTMLFKQFTQRFPLSLLPSMFPHYVSQKLFFLILVIRNLSRVAPVA